MLKAESRREEKGDVFLCFYVMAREPLCKLGIEKRSVLKRWFLVGAPNGEKEHNTGAEF